MLTTAETCRLLLPAPPDKGTDGSHDHASMTAQTPQTPGMDHGPGHAAAGAFSFAGITLSPAVGAILMSVSTIVVAANAQLLRRLDLTPPVLSGTAPTASLR